MKGWNEQEKVKHWVMFLFSIVMMARASEVASPYCPVYEDIEFPPVGSGWTTDGLPKYIIISLRHWKKRTSGNKGKPYPIIVYANPLNGRFYPVYWFLLYLSKSGIRSGPIFQEASKASGKGKDPWKQFTGKAVPTNVWCRACHKLFTEAGLYTPSKPRESEVNGEPHKTQVKGKGCTTHSIRISACQWAGRCEPTMCVDARNNGRWKNVKQMLIYHRQGSAPLGYDRLSDPINNIWVWRPVTAPGADNQQNM